MNTIGDFNVPTDFRELPEKGQRGPTCGLYAIEYAAVALGNTSVYATKGDTDVETTKTSPSLRAMAKKLNLSKLGEMFSAKGMAILINQLPPFGSKKLKGAAVACNIAEIQKTVQNNGYCLVPFDVSMEDNDTCGYPCNKNGLNAHWCVIVGYSDTELLVYHWGNQYQFNTNSLLASNAQLNNFPESFYIKWKNQGAKPTLKDPFDKIWISMQSYDRNIGNISYSEIVNPNSKGMAMLLLNGKEEYKNDICNIIKISACDFSDLRGKMVTITV